MKITANGKPYEVAEDTSLDDFLASLDLEPVLVVVERNRAALTPGEARRTRLEDGDSLEIVRIVAGG
ncbi:MAG: sulfur carrier protein ThiS [Puniceicoccaceae bacterium]|nr:MAG: sulfur carrier protein ThiS [Puniceicoccaceae bacterium]